MGCQNVKDSNVPTLLCFFETGNQNQADYCIKLIDNYKQEKTINYQIKSHEKMPFVIRFKIKNTTYDIQTVLDDNETTMNQTFQKCMIY